jgi:hypothetical protein
MSQNVSKITCTPLLTMLQAYRNSSNNTAASLRSAAPNPSVNQR